MASGLEEELLSVDFEIYGKVQGVFFRKHTLQQAKKLHLVGWVMNTKRNTVLGQIQGPCSKITQMKTWLKKTGSPKSRIEKAEFRDQRSLPKLTYDEFIVKK